MAKTNYIDSVNEEIFKSNQVFTIAITLIFGMILYLYLGENVNKGIGERILEFFLWIIISMIILVNLLDLLFDIKITTTISKYITDNPEVHVNIDTPEKEKEEEIKICKPEENVDKKNNEVFYVSGNKYRYKDAQKICKSLGARLATYDEIESAYENGGEWCGYGWSEDQMAYFPTQKKTWLQLQKSEKHKHDCGRPGINGGYISNPNVKFGVNCYGQKPSASEKEKWLMENTSYYNKSVSRSKNEKKQNKYDKKLEDLIISPFNENKWSRI